MAGHVALPTQRLEPLTGRPRVAAERAGPEDLADDRGTPEGRLLVRREAVEACRDDPMEGVRKRQIARRTALLVEPGELLGVQRVAARPLEEGLRGPRPSIERLPEHRRQQAGRLGIRQRLRGRRWVDLGPAPPQAGATVQSSGRAVQTTSSGASSIQSSSASRKSSSPSSAQ